MNVYLEPDRFPRSWPAMVSVVIPAYNAADLLPMQLAALVRQDYGHRWEIVVVDNSSTDGTAQVAEAWSDRLPVRVVTASDKPGVSYARNAGISEAHGALIAFCDADDEVSSGWLSAIVAASVESDAIGGAIDYAKLNNSVVMSWRNAPQRPLPRLGGRFFPMASGCNLSVWSDVFKALGGFNEKYVGGAEDVEFSWRLQLAGYRLSFSEQALLHYRLRGDLRALARQYFNYGRGDTRLYRDFGSDAMPRSGLPGALKGWAWVVVHLPDLVRGRSKRGIWLRIASRRSGWVIGSIEHRVLYLGPP